MSEWHEERRADRAQERAADRDDRRAASEERRRDKAAAAEQARKAQLAARREADARREQSRARRAELRGRLVTELDTAAALVVMACAIGSALYFQLRALSSVPGLPVPIAVALAVMLESGAWVATVAAERAKRTGRPAGRYRVVMWTCAAVAATVNALHAPASSHDWLAGVLAVASLAGPGFWELRGAGRGHGRAGRTRAERREARSRVLHDLRRRRRFATVHRRYRDILIAHPYATVAPEDAWRAAWRDVHGTDALAQTDAVLKARFEARLKVGETVGDAVPNVLPMRPNVPALGAAQTSPENAPEGTSERGTRSGVVAGQSATARPSKGSSEGASGAASRTPATPRTPRTGATGSEPVKQVPNAGRNARVRKSDDQVLQELAALRIGASEPLSLRSVCEQIGVGADRLKSLMERTDGSLDPLPTAADGPALTDVRPALQVVPS